MAFDADSTPRIYQDDSRYKLPRDAPEHERLDRQSAALVALMNDHPFHAPLSNPQKILDIGCGTGYMTHLLASTFAGARVIGIDLAAVPEARHEKLPNIEYVQGDIRELMGMDPRFELETFDYIFERFLMYGITDWPNHIASVAKLLKPGGWLEAQEPSMQWWSPKNEPLSDAMPWYQEFKSDANAIGIDTEIGDHLCNVFKSTRVFKDVKETKYKTAPKPSEAPERVRAFQEGLPDVFTLIVKKVSGAKRGEAEAERLLKDFRARYDQGFDEGTYVHISATVGQKQ